MKRETIMFECEIARLLKLFANADETKLALLEGAISDNARLRCQIEELNIIADKSGIVKVHPNNPSMQKELPVARQLTRLRASYVASCKLLCKELGGAAEEIDDELSDFE